MNPITRRGVVAAAGASTLAGCTGVASNLPIVGEDPVDTSGERTVIKEIDETVEVPVGEFHDWQFSSDQVTWMSYESESMGSYDIDYYLMNAENFEGFRNHGEFRISTNGSQENTEHIRVEDKFQPASYVLVVDNSDRGGTAPPGNADELGAPEVTLSLEAWVYR